MTIMTVEEMTKQKKNLLLIHWSSFAAMAVTFSAYLFSQDVFKGMDPRVSLITLFLAFVFYFCSVFHDKKAKKMEMEIEEQKKVIAILEKESCTFLGDLYSQERKGCPVLEILKGYSNGKYVTLYKEHVKLVYQKAQDRFNIRRRLLDGHCAAQLAKELLAIEATPTGKLVMLEMKMDLSG